MPQLSFINILFSHSEHEKIKIKIKIWLMSEWEPPVGQEKAVTCGKSKQEPLKTGFVPTEEVSIPLAGKSAHRGPWPSPPFLRTHLFHSALPKFMLCSWIHTGQLVAVSQTWFHLLTVSLQPPHPTEYVLVEWRKQKSFSKWVMWNFVYSQRDCGKHVEGPSALKRSYRLS